MKLITAIIQPAKLDDVKAALSEVGIKGLTVTEVRGYGSQKGHTEVYRGTEYRVDFHPKAKIETLVTDEEAQAVLDAVVSSARTGNIGDGKVWITDVSNVVRVRTGEAGPEAV